VSSAVVTFMKNAYIGESLHTGFFFFNIGYYIWTVRLCDCGEQSPQCTIQLVTSYWFIGGLTELQVCAVLDQASRRQTVALVDCNNKHNEDDGNDVGGKKN
jgi:hypothetical protein